MDRISHKNLGILTNVIYHNLLTPFSLCCAQISKLFAFIIILFEKAFIILSSQFCLQFSLFDCTAAESGVLLCRHAT